MNTSPLDRGTAAIPLLRLSHEKVSTPFTPFKWWFVYVASTHAWAHTHTHTHTCKPTKAHAHTEDIGARTAAAAGPMGCLYKAQRAMPLTHAHT